MATENGLTPADDLSVECPSCSAPLKHAARFCHQCGLVMDDKATVEASRPEDATFEASAPVLDGPDAALLKSLVAAAVLLSIAGVSGELLKDSLLEGITLLRPIFVAVVASVFTGVACLRLFYGAHMLGRLEALVFIGVGGAVTAYLWVAVYLSQALVLMATVPTAWQTAELLVAWITLAIFYFLGRRSAAPKMADDKKIVVSGRWATLIGGILAASVIRVAAGMLLSRNASVWWVVEFSPQLFSLTATVMCIAFFAKKEWDDQFSGWTHYPVPRGVIGMAAAVVLAIVLVNSTASTCSERRVTEAEPYMHGSVWFGGASAGGGNCPLGPLYGDYLHCPVHGSLVVAHTR